MIPVSKPLIAKNAAKYLTECLQTGWVSSKGPFVKRFEDAFAEYIGVKYTVAVNSGTAALHLSLAAIDIHPKDEVIVPALTMIAAALPVVYIGAIPVLVDVEKATGNINPSLIEAKITNKTKAIIVVHQHGHPVNMEPILSLGKKHKLVIIEDSAEAHGAEYKRNGTSQKVGSIGNIGCFSFYGNKIITTGEGGMVTTNNKIIAERIRSLRNLARSPKTHFVHQEIAFAYRMSNLEAALGLAQLEEIKRFVEKKIHIAKRYSEILHDVPSLILPIEKPYAKSVWWQYGVLLTQKAPVSSKQLTAILKKQGIETRPFVTPLHKQPAFLKHGLFDKQRYKTAELLSQQGLCLPSGLALKDKEINLVCKIIRHALNQ